MWVIIKEVFELTGLTNIPSYIRNRLTLLVTKRLTPQNQLRTGEPCFSIAPHANHRKDDQEIIPGDVPTTPIIEVQNA